MILITSAEFVSQEMRAEIGTIPPSFLPLGNRRLFEHQIRLLRDTYPGEAIWLSVPATYVIGSADERKLDRLDVHRVAVSAGLSLGGSILEALDAMETSEQGLRILHGDTLILDLPAGATDCIAVSDTKADAYSWAEEEQRAADETVWSGFFAFADRETLVRELRAANGRFVEAVRRYRAVRATPLQPTLQWLDFGHVNTLFKSRTAFTTQRHFNEIAFSDGIVTKRSSDAGKIAAEAEWFGAVPPAIRIHTPQLLEYRQGEKPCYSLEYLPVFPLNELYVFGRLSSRVWSGIFDRVADLLDKFRSLAPRDPATEQEIATEFAQLVRDKTISRLRDYGARAPFALDRPVTVNATTFSSVMDVAEDCIKAALAGPMQNAIMHGDMCFSNMLYDARSDRLKLIDPRGVTVSGKRTPYGDLRYDIAKLTHSVVGMYDHIIGGYYEVHRNDDTNYTFSVLSDPEHDRIRSHFLQRTFAGVAVSDVMPLTILLFMSMLPLHKDNEDRQLAFLLNGLMLYQTWRTL